MRTIYLHEFDRRDTVTLLDIINGYLIEEGIVPKSFNFHIHVEVEEEDT
jgi:hypothetical protein